MTLKLLDTFAGIGGFSYAAEKLVGGFKTTQFVEINPFCQKILKKHWPYISIHDDIKTYTAEFGEFDVITSGFPCQDISNAGLQKGITKETRSGLFYELMRIVRVVRPKYIVLENVAAIVNRGMDIVLGELSKAGYDAEYAVVSCKDLGGCHIRQRWWCIAKLANSDSKGLQRRMLQFNEELQETGHIGKKNTSSFTDSDSFRTQGKNERLTPIWQNAFLNSKERRTLSPNWRGYVSEPCLCRGDDGLRGRMDRIRSLGNSISPPVAAIPLQRILDLEKITN